MPAAQGPPKYLLEWDIVIDHFIRGGFYLIGGCPGGCLVGVLAISTNDFPAVEVHVVFVLEFVTSYVEVHGDILALLEFVQPGALVLDDLKLDVLGVVVVPCGDYKLAFTEPTGEGLGVENDFDFTCCLVHGHI